MDAFGVEASLDKGNSIPELGSILEISHLGSLFCIQDQR